MKENEIQQKIRLDASRMGWRLWRNNVGAGKLANGNFIRFGLANDSANMNEVIKSGDLIGIRPVLITQEMVGTTIGQFVSLEAKEPGWKYRGSPHEIAQLSWIEIITDLGGYAKFSKGDL